MNGSVAFLPPSFWNNKPDVLQRHVRSILSLLSDFTLQSLRIYLNPECPAYTPEGTKSRFEAW